MYILRLNYGCPDFARKQENPPKRVFKESYDSDSLVANVNHTTVHGAYLNHVTRLRGMDHLATADVDTAVMAVYADITRLRVGNARPAHEGTRGTQAAIATGEAIAYQARAVERVRANCTPLVGLVQLGVSTVYHAIARNGLRLAVVGCRA